MPIPLKYLAEFNENGIYHVYNRTNNREKLFLNDENRQFFLKNTMNILPLILIPFAGVYFPTIFIYW